MKGLPCLIPQFVCTSSNGLVACAGQASGVVVVFGIANDTETTVELPNGWSAVSGHWQHNLLVILARKVRVAASCVGSGLIVWCSVHRYRLVVNPLRFVCSIMLLHKKVKKG